MSPLAPPGYAYEPKPNTQTQNLKPKLNLDRKPKHEI